MKTVHDLDDDPASVGGAMGKWPLTTLWWLCRDERTYMTDNQVIARLKERNVTRLNRLTNVADDMGIKTRTLTRKKRVLDAADVVDMADALNEAYADTYMTGDRCPFEREGSDMACQRCPVAGKALESLMDGDILMNDRDQERDAR